MKGRDQKKGKVKKLLLAIFLVFAILMISVLVYLLHIGNKLTVTSYEIEAKINNPICIVQLSDLHQAEFGDNNSELIKLVKSQSPDIIAMTGDMQNKDDPDLDLVCSLVKDLSDTADVYYGYGNHEISWIKNYGIDIEDKLKKSGAVILNNCFSDVSINGNNIRIAGYEGYYGTPHMTVQDREEQIAETEFMRQFEDTNRYKILLDHIPTSWLDWEYINKYPVDLVLSGHYHGGMVCIPIIDKGLYAPYVGWFPKYTKGVYSGTQATCVLSSGLGSEYFIPRINNPPEIVAVNLVPVSE